MKRTTVADADAESALTDLAQMDARRRLAEEALRESEEQYRMLLDGIQDYAIFMMDPRGQIVSWNAGAERIKGYRADEIIGQNFSCFFPPEDIARGRPEEVLRMTAANGRHEEQGMRVRKDGSTIPGQRHLHRAARPGGKSPGVFRVQPRSQREQGVGGEVPRAAGGGSGRDGGGEPGRRDRPAEPPGGETVRLPPRRARRAEGHEHHSGGLRGAADRGRHAHRGGGAGAADRHGDRAVRAAQGRQRVSRSRSC